ncbi:hypothetical protein E2C01_004834 [Portunus trituberculatus]|uniref:Secreted protein n=1 Tax=Portunus trituberculatus TaxID=210409 RepID=A0A5B7CV00_PORTR|nr:hypothetical protein [Portunus trituberculatus]
MQPCQMWHFLHLCLMNTTITATSLWCSSVSRGHSGSGMQENGKFPLLNMVSKIIMIKVRLERMADERIARKLYL